MLELIDVRVHRGRQRPALAGVSQRFGRGVFGIVGPNGAGKTTLLRVAATLIDPSAGQVRFMGRRIGTESRWYRERLGYLPQEFGLYPTMTALQFVHYVGTLKMLDPAELDGLAAQALLAVGLDPRDEGRLGRYSEGGKRRVGLAAALVGWPEVIVLDEPMTSLDPVERLRLRNLLSDLSLTRIVLVSTHIISDLDGLASNILILDRGRAMFSGEAEELLRMAQGRVWGVEMSSDEWARASRTLAVSSVIRSGRTVKARVISETPPTSDAAPLDPTLEDSYMFVRTFSHSVS